MSSHARPTTIGAFVCGGAALAVVAIMFFGGGRLFSHNDKFIVYFTDPVNGLSVGAPVKFKGVQIGQVTDILIRYDQPGDNDDIPVIIEIDATRLHKQLGVKADLSDDQTFKQQVDDEGLRALLQFQSIVTAQLYVELDYMPDDPKRKPIQLSPEYKEIPSVPSGLSEVMKSVTTALQNLSKVDFGAMADRVNHLIDQLNDGVGQVNFKDINDTLVAAGNNLNGILTDPKLKEAIAKLGVTLDTINSLASNLNQQVQPLSTEIQSTTQHVRGTLDEMDATLRSVRDMIAPDSTLRFELDKALTEITSAGRALRVLADYLESNPSALIFGKDAPAGYTPPAANSTPAPAANSSPASPGSAPSTPSSGPSRPPGR